VMMIACWVNVALAGEVAGKL